MGFREVLVGEGFLKVSYFVERGLYPRFISMALV